MEGSGEALLVKEDSPSPAKEPNKKDDETLVYCSRKKKSRPRSLSSCCQPSFLSIATSLNNNCCACIGAFARYIRAVVGCLSCLAICRLPQMQFEKLFGELIEAACDTCYDIMSFIRKIFECCVGCK